MPTSNINIRIDDELKTSADTLFNDLGLTMTAAITMFLKTAVRYDGIPFELRLNEYNAETKSALNETNAGKNLHGPFSSVEELMEDLNA